MSGNQSIPVYTEFSTEGKAQYFRTQPSAVDPEIPIPSLSWIIILCLTNCFPTWEFKLLPLFLCSFQFYFRLVQFFPGLIWSETPDRVSHFSSSMTTISWSTQKRWWDLLSYSSLHLLHPVWWIWFPDLGPASLSCYSPWLGMTLHQYMHTFHLCVYV